MLVPNVRIELEILFEKGCGGFFLVPETAGHIHAIDLDRLANISSLMDIVRVGSRMSATGHQGRRSREPLNDGLVFAAVWFGLASVWS